MTPDEAEKETVRRAREHLARSKGPRGLLHPMGVPRSDNGLLCCWCQSQDHYSPACPSQPQQEGRGRR